MRVIAGSLGGRQFDAPSGHKTHPMSEKARGGLFNALGDIENLTVLDAFSGTGALSFEALSRGSGHVTAIDSDRNAGDTIIRNIKSLSLGGKIKLVKANASAWSDNNPNQLFDLVFCDPPYDDIKEDLLEKLSLHSKLGGVIVYSLPPASEFILNSSFFNLLSQKSYGDAQLYFYRKTA